MFYAMCDVLNADGKSYELTANDSKGVLSCLMPCRGKEVIIQFASRVRATRRRSKKEEPTNVTLSEYRSRSMRRLGLADKDARRRDVLMQLRLPELLVDPPHTLHEPVAI